MTKSQVSEWCEGSEQLVLEAESLSRRLQQGSRPPAVKNLDPDDAQALAETYTRFMAKWEDIPSATRRLQSAGESLAKVGPEALANRLLGIVDTLRPTLDGDCPDLPEKSAAIMTGWFRGGIGFLDGRLSDGSAVPMATGTVDKLPEGHWARTVLPEHELYLGPTPTLIFGPMERGRPLPCYPVNWVVAYTRQFRRPQAEEERRREEFERQQRAQAEAARASDPAWQLRNLTERLERIEAENAELKAKLESKND